MRQKAESLKAIISGRPYFSLTLFVILVLAISIAFFARYQYVQAEIAAKQSVAARIQGGLDNWRDDLAMRLNDLGGGLRGTVQGAGNFIGGGWGVISYLGTAFLDFIGNLHIMMPVAIIYIGVGFFGNLKIRVATLIGALGAFLISTRMGIVPGSVIGLILMLVLLVWHRVVDPRLLAKLQELPVYLKSLIQRKREDNRESPVDEAL